AVRPAGFSWAATSGGMKASRAATITLESTFRYMSVLLETLVGPNRAKQGRAPRGSIDDQSQAVSWQAARPEVVNRGVGGIVCGIRRWGLRCCGGRRTAANGREFRRLELSRDQRIGVNSLRSRSNECFYRDAASNATTL